MAEKTQEQVFEYIEPPTEKYQWYLLFVANGKEFKVRDQILRIPEAKKKVRQIWIPSITKVIQTKNREQAVQRPLISGYIFILLDVDQKEMFNKIIEFEDVYSFLWKGQFSQGLPTIIPFDEIQKLEFGINKVKQIHMTPSSQYKEKDYVRISHGIFKNLKGFVKEVRKNFIIIELEEDVIHRKLAVSVSIDNIEQVTIYS